LHQADHARRPQRRRASKPLPQIDPQLVAACKARNPNFGLGIADSDKAGHAFQSEAGHPFRFEAGHGSDLKSAT